uniref:Uncharacterized protein n=1 Tax=Caenorhabditis japonica TaxID=281687 RepID=A0A8R1EI23_CAEJA
WRSTSTSRSGAGVSLIPSHTLYLWSAWCCRRNVIFRFRFFRLLDHHHNHWMLGTVDVFTKGGHACG